MKYSLQLLSFSFALLLSFIACKEQQLRIEERNQEGQLVRSFSIDKDSLKQGDFMSYYSDGKSIYEHSQYVNDRLHGIRTLYYDNGNKEIVESYTNGVLNDSLLVYYADGQLKLIQKYTHGVLEGQAFKYYPDGTLQEEIWFSENLENGPFKEYYPNGNIKWTGHYKDGDNERGELLFYNENGQLAKKLFCDSLSICRTIWEKS